MKQQEKETKTTEKIKTVKDNKDVFIPGLSKRPRKTTVCRDLDEESNKFNSVLVPNNVKEQKDRFMTYGLSPQFKYQKGYEPLYKAGKSERYQIRTDLYNEAKAIIDKVCDVHGNGFGYVDKAFGNKITQEEANEFILKYIRAHDLEGCMTVYWSPTLIASAKMMWIGPNQKLNKPELRKYSFVIKNSPENIYIREDGIKCLVNHEIGSHYFRFFNDGQQPWFSDRQKFGLSSQSARKMIATEEGLATLNTLLSAKSKYLWGAAILYYIACKAASMSFRQLYDHMAQYVPDKELRWRHIVRVKRGIPDVTQHGGFGNDQVYFEGAVEILRNIDNLDFNILHCGRISLDEVNRVKRLARMDCIRIPHFLKDVNKYKRMLKHIAYVNGLSQSPPKPPKPVQAKSARFKMNVPIPYPPPKQQIEPNLLSLLNFNFKDPPVEYQPVYIVTELDTPNVFSFIYPLGNQNPYLSTPRKVEKSPFDDYEDHTSESESMKTRSNNRMGPRKRRRLLNRPTSSLKEM